MSFILQKRKWGGGQTGDVTGPNITRLESDSAGFEASAD